MDFNSHLYDITNESFALGEKISKAKLVKKAFRSLSLRFAYKVTTIKEVNDVDSMGLVKLTVSL